MAQPSPKGQASSDKSSKQQPAGGKPASQPKKGK